MLIPEAGQYQKTWSFIWMEKLEKNEDLERKQLERTMFNKRG